jgi:hypothetical protein
MRKVHTDSRLCRWCIRRDVTKCVLEVRSEEAELLTALKHTGNKGVP